MDNKQARKYALEILLIGATVILMLLFVDEMTRDPEPVKDQKEFRINPDRTRPIPRLEPKILPKIPAPPKVLPDSLSLEELFKRFFGPNKKKLPLEIIPEEKYDRYNHNV